MAEQTKSAGPRQGSPAIHGSRRTAFVGREAELAVLSARLEAAERGEGGVIGIGGEPGIGKSRLLAEFAQTARTAGWAVLLGRAYDSEGMPPYLPFVEVLRDYVPSASDGALALLVREAPELAALIPALAERMATPAPGPALTPEAHRFRLFEGVSSLLLQAAQSSESRGLLLCMEDLHWADKPTLDLLLHLARKLPGARLLIAGTYRTVDVDASNSLPSVLAELNRARLGESLPLGGLSREESMALIRTLGFGAVPTALIEAIQHQTDGNPFYVEEIVHHLQAEGRDPSDPGLVGGGWGIPEGVRQVIGKRLSRLGPEANRVLQVAAVLGDGFQFEIAAAATGLDESSLVDTLDDSLQAGILREEGEAYRFSHALIRRAIYDGLTIARRHNLHLAAARAIEHVHVRNLEPHVSALAVHCRLAGPLASPETTIDYSLRAGEAAKQAFAYEEAEAHWEAALKLMQQEGAEPAVRARLIERLGELLQVVGFDNYAKSAEHFEQALQLYEEIGATAEAAAVHARLGLLLGAGGVLNDNVRALSHLRAAEPALRDGPASDAQLSLWSGLGLVAVWQVHTTEGLESSRRAMEAALSLGKEDRWVTNAVMHSYHLNARGRLEEGLELMARAWDVANRLNDTYRAFVAAFWLGARLMELGDPLEARGWFLREVGQPRQLHAPTRRQSLQVAIAETFAQTGEMEARQGMLAEAGGRPGPGIGSWEGRWDEAEAIWTNVRETAPAALNRANQARADHSLARISRLRGDDASATGFLLDELAIGLDGPDLIIQMRTNVELAVTYSERGLLDEAETHLIRCREILAAGEDWRGIGARLALAEAVYSAARGRHEEADGHFERAIQGVRSLSVPWDEAEGFEVWASSCRRFYRGRGRRSFVMEKLGAARNVYHRIGAGQQWLERLNALEMQLLGTAAKASEDDLPDNLTAREVEVLRLIALGRSNKEIGAGLVLSVRTVERHIANIYLKTGMHGRVEAASYAHAHGLSAHTT